MMELLVITGMVTYNIVQINAKGNFLTTSCLDNCPPGTYGNADGQCTPCPIKTYQYEQGQTKCMSCQYGFATKRKGALSPVECYDARK